MNFGEWGVGLQIIPVVLTIGVLSFLLSKWKASRLAAIASASTGAVVGGALAIDAARLPGSTADYNFAFAWLLSGACLAASVVMLPFPPLRRGATLSFFAGMCLLGAFYLIVMSAELLGLTTWRT
jgi:hypothetical protein